MVVDVRDHARSLRGRSTLLVTAIVTAALLIGAAGMLAVFGLNLRSNLDQTLAQQAEDRARLISGGADPASVVGLQREEAFVWVGTPDGMAVAVGGSTTPVDNPVPGQLGQVVEMELRVEERKPDERSEVELHEFRVASAVTADGQLVVLSGSELEIVGEAVGQLGRLVLTAVPLIALLVAGLTWYTVGRSLAPVDSIRRTAETITGTGLSERVPVPESGDEIQGLAETMNRMLDRLETHRDSLRQFTSDASHELKSPVANVRAIIDTASLDDESWPSVRARLTSEIDRLRDLVDNLLFLASHAEGVPDIGEGRVAVDDLLFDAAETQTLLGRITVNVDEVSPVVVRGSRADLERLVRNLIENAARHADTTVWLGSEELDDAIRLTVADDGHGIAPEDRDRVFDRFTRLDPSRDRESGGTGLGLSIVKQIAEGHGGSVSVDRSPAGRTRFVVTLPAG